jgi:SNF2 family DNA or RNA helicase
MKQLRQYQQIAVDKGINANLICSDQMGLGKSLTAIEICKAVFSQCDAPALVIVPKGIRLQWETMIYDQDPNASVLIADNDPDFFKFEFPLTIDYLIIHYELLVILHSILANHRWSTVVVDECHRIKNRKAQRTIAVKTLKAFRKIGLSGTPYDKNPADLFSILQWLQPKQFTSYWKFVDEFIDIESVWVGARQVPKSFKIRDPKAFVEMLKPHMIRRTKKSVLPQLPPLQKTFVPIELTPAQRKAYQAIKNVKDMEVSFPELSEPMWIEYAMTKLVRLLQCARDPAGLG